MSENQQTTPTKTGRLTPASRAVYGVIAEFDSPSALKKGAKAVRDAGFRHWDCYSPFPVHGIDPAMGIRRTILPLLVLGGGLCGLSLGLFLQWWTNAYDWPWIVSGKPFFSLPANIPIAFETTVLLSAFTAFFGMWALNKLPKPWHPVFHSDRFRKVSDDGFFLAIEARDSAFDDTATPELLTAAGAEAIETIEIDTDPRKKRMPKPLTMLIIITTCAALVPFALIARSRTKTSPDPHLHLIPDMDFQFKAHSQAKTDLFADKRVSRLPVEGTVAYGELKQDDHFYRGLQKQEGQETPLWATSFPSQFEITLRSVRRGQDRYGIYCSPCHGLQGNGKGMVAERAKSVPVSGWNPPADLLQDYVIQQPHGQLFNTISHGKGGMMGYAAQLPENDRWAIVLYIRALQRSQNATMTDVPPQDAQKVIH